MVESRDRPAQRVHHNNNKANPIWGERASKHVSTSRVKKKKSSIFLLSTEVQTGSTIGHLAYVHRSIWRLHTISIHVIAR